PAPGRAPRELVLDVVVERKSAADLGNSLRDGRYREQKFRLRRSGLRCPIYLLEEPGEGEPLPLPLPTLRQAAANTQVRPPPQVGPPPKHRWDPLQNTGNPPTHRYDPPPQVGPPPKHRWDPLQNTGNPPTHRYDPPPTGG
ncbi:MUS81 endonuclease, partial [Onychorhynchus coronatus]|nr:MUS81 endonuclease [Onychorhynchus coronatus]